MVAGEYGAASALRVDDGEWRRLIASNPRIDGRLFSSHSVALPGTSSCELRTGTLATAIRCPTRRTLPPNRCHGKNAALEGSIIIG
jgi:hypothetical protein